MASWTWLVARASRGFVAVSLLVILLLVSPAARAACTGTVPGCGPCLALHCTPDGWSCDPRAAGTACNDGLVCTTSPKTCDGFGSCNGTAVSCAIANGSGICTEPTGCSYSCNPGYQLQGSACNAIPADATITLAPSITSTTSGTGGLTARVRDQAGAGASYAWSISGGTITAGAGTPQITFTAATVLTTATAALTMTVSVTVTTAANQKASSSSSITVYASADSTMAAPSALTVGVQASANVVTPQAGASYAWTIGNGTISGSANSSGVTFTASAVGSLTPQLTVTNGAGQVSTNPGKPIPVYATPVAAISAPSAVTSQTSASASVQDPGDTYAWTIDGGTITSPTNANVVTFTAGTGATLTLHCTVTNPAGAQTLGSLNVPIAPPPVSTFVSSRANVTAKRAFRPERCSASGDLQLGDHRRRRHLPFHHRSRDEFDHSYGGPLRQ